MSENKNSCFLGKDIIYVCQMDSCSSREKEFALVDRQYKYCSKCGSISIKSTLCESYQYIPLIDNKDDNYE